MELGEIEVPDRREGSEEKFSRIKADPSAAGRARARPAGRDDRWRGMVPKGARQIEGQDSSHSFATTLCLLTRGEAGDRVRCDATAGVARRRGSMRGEVGLG